ncbi:MAG TPA: cupredoxin domain-containing protein [Thermomicrobiales bacterium]|nr:cupredoxin domain-containing protein [Thermomicrobiales bacterium]
MKNRIRARRGIVSLAVGLTLALALIGLILPAHEARAQDAVSVSIHNFAFDPGTITITAGTTVTWTNNDSTTHTVTADDGAFDSGNLPTGQSFSMTFDTPGTFTYHCAIHPNMTATIIVTDASTSGGSGATTTDNQAQTTTSTSTPDMTNMTMPNTGAGHTTATHSNTGTAFLILALAAVGLMGAGIGFRVRHHG